MARGSRFALNKPATRDEKGRSLPSHKSMLYVEVQLVCKQHLAGDRPILGAWAVETTEAVFDPAQVFERPNKDVVTQLLPDEGDGTRLRFKLRCPKCTNSPVVRQERIDEVLRVLYAQGVGPIVKQVPL